MRNIILTIVLFVFLLTQANSQWEILNEGANGNFNSIDFVGDIGWIAGGNFWGGGLLWRTEDSGENWVSVELSDDYYIKMIDFINESAGWVIGKNKNVALNPAIILKSDDGGINWTLQNQIPGVILNSLFVVNENFVYVIGDEGIILNTTDSGQNWNLHQLNQLYNLYSIWFWSPDSGIVTGSFDYGSVEESIVLKTTDAGNNWQEIYYPQFNNIINLQSLDNVNFYFKATQDTINYIGLTNDRFETLEIKVQHPYSINSYHYLNDNTAYAVMGDSLIANNVMKSTNGGINWFNIQPFNFEGSSFELTKIYFTESMIGFGLSDILLSSILYKSSGNGEDWFIQQVGSSISDLFFLDDKNGIVLTNFGSISVHPTTEGLIFFTTDGGISWTNVFNTLGVIRRGTMVNQSTGFALGRPCKIFKTYNGGINWSLVYEHNTDSSEYPFYSNDISFKNNEIGFMVGNYGNIPRDTTGAGILHSEDSGYSWQLVWLYPDSIFVNNYTHQLKSVCVIEDVFWTVGDAGMIVKYTEQTGWDLRSSVTDLPLNKVYFYDANNGWISGGYINNNGFQHILLKSTDGGENWSEIMNLNYLINDICFYNSDIGFAAGVDENERGILLKTADGGDNWGTITDNLTGPLNSLFLKDEYGWAAGAYGLLLKTTNAGATWVDERNDKIYPTEYYLEQNYPNPFNPTTTIKYQIPKSSFVTLKIYDVLGNEIETLVNEEKVQGVYKVVFNSNNLSSGIYFYKIKTGDFVEAKKMVFIK